MADNYTALKSSQKKRYISKETFNSLDLSQIPVGSEYEVVSPIEKGDLSADINNALNKAEKSIPEPTNQTTGSDGDVLVKKGGGSEWKSMPIPGVVQGTGQSTTDVMSQKATTDSLNLLEAKLNENIVKDPSKTYAVIKGSECRIENGSGLSSGSIDFGDGMIVNFPTPDFEFTHTYTDGVDMHIVSVSGVTQLPSVLFSNHAGPIKVITGDNVTSIGGGICNRCTNLEEFVIGKNVTDITSFSIISGTPIKILRVLATTPPTCASYDAQVPNLEKILVPKSAINAYKAATGWSQYADKIVYEVDSSDLPDTSKFAKLNEDNYFKGNISFENPILIYGNKAAIQDVDGNTFYFPANLDRPSSTYTLATTDDVDAKSSFSVEVW